MIRSLDEAGRVLAEGTLAAAEAPGARRAVAVCAADPAELAEGYTRIAAAGDCPLVLSPLLSEAQRARVAAAAAGQLPGAGHLLCTSGTTSPDAVPRLYFFGREAALGNARAHNASLGLEAGERVLLPMSISHSFGLVAAGLGCSLLGAPLFAFRATPDPATLLAAAAAHEITTLYLTPPLARLLLRQLRRRAARLPSLRRVSVGSAGMTRAELVELATRLPGAQVYFTYGLTELGPRVTTWGPVSPPHGNYPPTPATAGGGSADRPAPADRQAPIGRPLEGVALEVRAGELHVRSRWASLGLWHDAQLHPIAGSDGFVATRDAARLADTEVELLGRIDGVIVMGGGNIYPDDVERVADSVTGVAASCLVGRPSPLYGEVPVLVCELELHSDAATVGQILAERLRATFPASQLPVDTLFRPLPRTSAGKVARGRVRAEIEHQP